MVNRSRASGESTTLRYTSFLMLFGAFGLVSSTVSLINSNSKVHVIFTWADVTITWLLELLLFRITDHLAFESCPVF